MADVSIEIQGIDDVVKNISKVVDNLETQLKNAIEKASTNTAEDIKVIFKGGTSPGFKDRTGALRNSISGGLVDNPETDTIQGFVGAGDDTLGDNGKQTKDYVAYIEFGEFSKAGSTSFLRAGVQASQRQIADIIKNEINIEGLL